MTHYKDCSNVPGVKIGPDPGVSCFHYILSTFDTVVVWLQVQGLGLQDGMNPNLVIQPIIDQASGLSMAPPGSQMAALSDLGQNTFVMATSGILVEHQVGATACTDDICVLQNERFLQWSLFSTSVTGFTVVVI